MRGLWALVAPAQEADATTRATAGAAMVRWVTGGGSGVVLVTCHRAEVYGLGPSPEISQVRMLGDEAAVRHLFRVASGLESVIVGEDEVLHQVREALRVALRLGVDPRLQRLFETAVAVGRRARARRTESSGNLAQRAVAWLTGKAELDGRRVIVAGAGRMGSALAHAAAAAGARVVVASRNPAHAMRLARLYDGDGVGLDAGAAMVAGSAGVGVALGGPWLELAAVARADLPPIADISAPPAIPLPVRRRLNGSFLGIDDLFAERTGSLPGPYATQAERLVESTTGEFTAWLERAP